MKMIKATNGSKTIKTTEKMFRLIYAEQGYVIAGSDEEATGQSDDKTLSEMTLTELRKLAKEKGVKNSGKLTTEELLKHLEPPKENSDDEQNNDNLPANEQGEGNLPASQQESANDSDVDASSESNA